MNESAHVTAIDALSEFRSALLTYGEQAKEALGMIDMEIQRTYAFLDDQKKHWQAAVRQAEDLVIQTKTELNRRTMMKIGDRAPDTTQQEKEHRLALARLEHAQEKLANVFTWLRTLPDELTEYEGPARQLGNVLEYDVPKMTSFLEHKIADLEAYVQRG